MQFRYPAQLQPDGSGAIVVSFRDLPECLTAGADEAEALKEAGDALEEAIAGRIDDAEPIPVPSRLRAGERLIAVPPDMAAKAAFVLAFRASGLSRLAVAAPPRRQRKSGPAVARPASPHGGHPSAHGVAGVRPGARCGVSDGLTNTPDRGWPDIAESGMEALLMTLPLHDIFPIAAPNDYKLHFARWNREN